MSTKTKYNWDSDKGIAIVQIEDKNGNIFVGSAQCHPDDKEFMSEKIGYEIAEIRASLNMIRYIRDTETKPQLKILNHIFSNMKTSKQFNSRSYEASMVRRQIHILQADLAAIKELITNYNNHIRELSEAALTYQTIKMGKNN